ncbi:hypothetical protein [Cryobacterium sp. PAMC25264]|uniref:hypothetical protein n=1 Tax=Cryobacterium sp. PAMC25264 TaxID=2861288 RepID=UPI001C63AE8A|nr:hypothetical protein [Cryobacterium sp. PAMC25264]QYF72445.1 hypothetical protein KY500_11405 [Cryobacterium sp. PAMC25264]
MDNNRTAAGADVDEPMGDPREMLALLESQQREVLNAQKAPVIWMYFIWGITWFVGFLALWSGDVDGNPWFTIPAYVATPVFIIMLVVSIVASAVLGIRINRGVRGTSTFSGAVYGVSWSACGTAFAMVGTGLISQGLSPELANLYFPAAYALMCGTIYLGGAALWRDVSQLVLGLVLLTVGAASTFAGSPGNDLVLALGVGGAFLVAAGTLTIRRRANR